MDTGTDELLARVDEGVAVVTFNRPERRNALTKTTIEALGNVLMRLEPDPAVGCVVLTGAGGAFCAGGDVKGFAEEGMLDRSYDEQVHRQRLSHRRTSGALYRMPKPTIAAIPGAAAGAGLSLALACDLRLAAESAIFTTAFANVALAGDYGGTWFLTRLVGVAKAKELYFLAERFDAAEALRLGIVNRVVPDEALQEEAMSLARRLATGPAVAYRYMKENLNRAMVDDLEACMDLEATHHLHTGTTEDLKEAAAAFVEKRAPVFRGR